LNPTGTSPRKGTLHVRQGYTCRAMRWSLTAAASAACRQDPEPLHGVEIGDRVDPVAREFEGLDRHCDISTHRRNPAGRRCIRTVLQRAAGPAGRRRRTYRTALLLTRIALQSCVFAQDSKSWKATSGNSRRSAARSTAKPTRSNHSYILTASSPIRWRMTSSGIW
jgi:hypothetical protein